MEGRRSWARRRDELLAQLAARAASCPGLYPFRSPEEFLRVAQDHSRGEVETVCAILEKMWHRPEEAVQLNAQSLIQRGKGWESPAADNEGQGKRLRS